MVDTGNAEGTEMTDIKTSDLHLPPLMQPIILPTIGGSDFIAAVTQRVSAGQYGAGDVIWHPHRQRLQMAIAMEPDISATRCAALLPTLMVGFADALGALIPPEVAVAFRAPATILVNEATAGMAEMAQAPVADGNAIPDWLVVSITCALQPEHLHGDPGHTPDRTTLWDEGCGRIEAQTLYEATARHFMVWLHRWQSEGEAPVMAAWRGRLLASEGAFGA